MNPQKPEEYIAQWETRLAREKAQRRDGKTPVVLFRLGENWLALATLLVREVTEPRIVRRIPHRTNEYLLGLVNVRGILRLCIHLGHLLKLETEECHAPNVIQRQTYPRMLVIQKAEEAWAFSADEIHSLYRISNADMIRLRDEEKCSKGIIEWQGKTVNVLDENLLFPALARTAE